MANSKSYTGTQIFLHWLIVALVFFQYIANSLVQTIWDARVAGKIPDEPVLVFHVFFGLVVLVLALWRIALILRDGMPETTRNAPRVQRIITASLQGLLYVLLLAVPLSGAAAWFWTIVPAAALHTNLEIALLVVIALHVAYALVQQLWLHNHVIMRMIGRI